MSLIEYQFMGSIGNMRAGGVLGPRSVGNLVSFTGPIGKMRAGCVLGPRSVGHWVSVHGPHW